MRLIYFLRDVRVELVGRRKLDADPPDRDGEELRDWSEDSQRRLLWITNNTAAKWKSMLTLTYGELYPTLGTWVSEHRRLMLKAIRQHYGDCLNLWVREYQSRFAPHLHILLTLPLRLPTWPLSMPEGYQGPQSFGDWQMHCWASEQWQSTIKHFASEKGLRAGIRWEALKSSRGGAAYLAKYLGKLEQKAVPDEAITPGRWWGHSAGAAVPRWTHIRHVSLAEYLATVEGAKASPSGCLFSTLHDGRKRCARWLADNEGGDAPAETKRPTGTLPPKLKRKHP